MNKSLCLIMPILLVSSVSQAMDLTLDAHSSSTAALASSPAGAVATGSVTPVSAAMMAAAAATVSVSGATASVTPRDVSVMPSIALPGCLRMHDNRSESVFEGTEITAMCPNRKITAVSLVGAERGRCLVFSQVSDTGVAHSKTFDSSSVGRDDTVTAIVFSNNSNGALVRRASGLVEYYNLTDWESITVQQLPNTADIVAISPDGTSALLGLGCQVTLYNLRDLCSPPRRIVTLGLRNNSDSDMIQFLAFVVRGEYALVGFKHRAIILMCNLADFSNEDAHILSPNIYRGLRIAHTGMIGFVVMSCEGYFEK